MLGTNKEALSHCSRLGVGKQGQTLSKQAARGMYAVGVRVPLVTVMAWPSISQELNLNDLEVLLVFMIYHRDFMFAYEGSNLGSGGSAIKGEGNLNTKSGCKMRRIRVVH